MLRFLVSKINIYKHFFNFLDFHNFSKLKFFIFFQNYKFIPVKNNVVLCTVFETHEIISLIFDFNMFIYL